MSLREIVDIAEWERITKAYLRAVDELPHHYHLHLMHGAQILGFKHPNERIRAAWLWFYAHACDDMHLPIESEDVMDARLCDWRQENWSDELANEAPHA